MSQLHMAARTPLCTIHLALLDHFTKRKNKLCILASSGICFVYTDRRTMA